MIGAKEREGSKLGMQPRDRTLFLPNISLIVFAVLKVLIRVGEELKVNRNMVEASIGLIFPKADDYRTLGRGCQKASSTIFEKGLP